MKLGNGNFQDYEQFYFSRISTEEAKKENFKPIIKEIYSLRLYTSQSPQRYHWIYYQQLNQFHKLMSCKTDSFCQNENSEHLSHC